MIELTTAELARIVGGRLHRCSGRERITAAAEFDSRRIEEGGLFVALPGERTDGHRHAGAAVEGGAAAVLAGREVDAPAVIAPATDTDFGRDVAALAGDTDGTGAAVLHALSVLAGHVCRVLVAEGLTVIGVTGSSGKTSTKDLISQVLGGLGPTVAPPGSFNNELGHPWTVLRADRSTRFLVLELSARGTGHIARLTRTAPPSIGAVLNVGSAHLGEFGSREAIAEAKSELVQALPAADAGGWAILNADDPVVAGMAQRTDARVVLVGQGPEAEVRASEVRLDAAARPEFLLHAPHAPPEGVSVSLQLAGSHHVSNALTAAAIGIASGMSAERVAERLGTADRLSGGRMEVTQRRDGVTVIDDAYNANPESMRAALRALADFCRPVDGPARRGWAVLGLMGELGPAEAAAHDEIGRLAVRLGIRHLVVVGQQALPMHHGAHLEGSFADESIWVPDTAAALDLLNERLEAGDVVLVKASKVAGLRTVAESLRNTGGEQ